MQPGLCTNRPSPPLKNGVSRNKVSVAEAVLKFIEVKEDYIGFKFLKRVWGPLFGRAKGLGEVVLGVYWVKVYKEYLAVV